MSNPTYTFTVGGEPRPVPPLNGAKVARIVHILSGVSEAWPVFEAMVSDMREKHRAKAEAYYQFRAEKGASQEELDEIPFEPSVEAIFPVVFPLVERNFNKELFEVFGILNLDNVEMKEADKAGRLDELIRNSVIDITYDLASAKEISGAALVAGKIIVEQVREAGDGMGEALAGIGLGSSQPAQVSPPAKQK